MSVASGIDAIPAAVNNCVSVVVSPVLLASSIAAAISGFCVAAVNANGLLVSLAIASNVFFIPSMVDVVPAEAIPATAAALPISPPTSLSVYPML